MTKQNLANNPIGSGRLCFARPSWLLLYQYLSAPNIHTTSKLFSCQLGETGAGLIPKAAFALPNSHGGKTFCFINKARLGGEETGAGSALFIYPIQSFGGLAGASGYTDELGS